MIKRRSRRFAGPARFGTIAALLVAFLLGAFLPVAVLLGAFLGAAQASGQADPVRAMKDIARELDIQTALPTGKTPLPPPPSDFHLHLPGTVAEWILYGALIVGVCFALFALRDLLPGAARRAKLKAQTAVVVPQTIESVERMEETGDEADELARRGLLAEAMHMLLLRSLIELRKRLGITLADSLTSREILRRLTLPEIGRHALGDLIERVEFVHFGKRPALPEDYGACRASYESLIGAMLTPSPAEPAAA